MSLDANKAVIGRLAAALNAGDPSAGLEIWADDLVLNGQTVGAATIAQMRAPLWAAVADIRFTPQRLIAEADWVAVHWSVTGTHTGDFSHPVFGAAKASGRPFRMTYMDHYRIADGRIVEVWEVRDALTLLQQLGVIPAAQPVS